MPFSIRPYAGGLRLIGLLVAIVGLLFAPVVQARHLPSATAANVLVSDEQVNTILPNYARVVVKHLSRSNSNTVGPYGYVQQRSVSGRAVTLTYKIDLRAVGATSEKVCRYDALFSRESYAKKIVVTTTSKNYCPKVPPQRYAAPTATVSEVYLNTERARKAIAPWQNHAYQYLLKQGYYEVDKPGTTEKMPWRHYDVVYFQQSMFFQKTASTPRKQCLLTIKLWVSGISKADRDWVRVNTTSPAGCPWIARFKVRIPDTDPLASSYLT